MTNEQVANMKHVADAGSALVAVGALASILPPIASLLTIVWMAIRIYETKTVQGLLKRLMRED